MKRKLRLMVLAGLLPLAATISAQQAEQFKVATDDTYAHLQSVIDFISNMTDLYAVQLYKDLRGID